MSKKGRRYTPEQIITKLREAEVLQSQGMSIEEVARKLEIASQTYYRWRKEYGDMNTTQARKLKDLEKENLRLKKLVADLSLDNAILKEVLSKNVIADTKHRTPGQAQRSSGPGDGSHASLRTPCLPGDWTTKNNATLSQKEQRRRGNAPRRDCVFSKPIRPIWLSQDYCDAKK